MNYTRFLFIIAVGLLSGCGPDSRDSASPVGTDQGPSVADASPADALWQKVVETTRQPSVPEAWQDREPSPGEMQAFRSDMGRRAMVAASTAQDFYTRYPQDSRSEQARQVERDMLQNAILSGNYEGLKRLQEIESSILADPELDDDQRFDVMARGIQREASLLAAESEGAAIDAMRKGVLKLRKEFPDRQEPLEMMMMLAESVAPDDAKSMLEEIIQHAKDPSMQEAARSLQAKLEALGRPVELSFKSLKGDLIDLQGDYKGKVVLLDFWATWCGPCIAELPNVKKVYQEWHDKGFEIIGISLDNSEQDLRAFLEREGMTWPQYFDGKGWENQFAVSFGITGIPAMWLIDQNGLLVDMNARSDLASKVGALLQR